MMQRSQLRIINFATFLVGANASEQGFIRSIWLKPFHVKAI